MTKASPTALILGHGAAGNAAAMQPWVIALKSYGVTATAIDLPKGKAERAMPRFATALADHPNAAIGGHSYGGRVASLVAAEQPVRALVLLSYPLHRPGFPDELRTAHWKAINCPVLVLSGERDPFAKLNLLRREVKRLKSVELVTYPGAGHGLLADADDAAQRIAAFLAAHT